MDVTQSIVDALEEPYKERLESDIVAALSRRFNLDASSAMALYYSSKLARQIDEGAEGIQYLSANYLVDDLEIHEPELFDGMSDAAAAPVK